MNDQDILTCAEQAGEWLLDRRERLEKYEHEPATLLWLDENLAKLDKQKPTVVFTHFPLGFGAPLLLKNAEAVLERFKGTNLQAAYSGHFHGFTELKAQNAILTTNKCCSYHRANHHKTPEKGYFHCQAKQGKLIRKFVEVK